MMRLVKAFADPVALAWVGVMLWVAMRLWYRQWLRAIGAACLGLVMFLCSSQPITARLLASLERPYAGLDLSKVAPADAVVLLGGVLDHSPNDAFKLNLGLTADRVVAAAELLRLGKSRTLVLGGGGPREGKPGPTEGELVQGWLAAWGFTNVTVIRLGACTDTRDEALRTLALVQTHKWRRVHLVTSAWHLRRAEAVFRKAKVPVNRVGCDFEGLSRLGEEPLSCVVPSVIGVTLGKLYLHEQMGWLVYWARGWI